jgi:hypothetical protein
MVRIIMVIEGVTATEEERQSDNDKDYFCCKEFLRPDAIVKSPKRRHLLQMTNTTV